MGTPAGGPPPAVKICGLCRPEDAALAAAAGAHYTGVILAPGTPRSQSLAAARGIFGAAAGAVRVGVFVDPPLAAVREAAERLELHIVQLHGGEPPETGAALRGLGLGVWKALRPRSPEELREGIRRYGDAADALLLDGFSERAAGGTGSAFDWRALAPLRLEVPATLGLVVAGGLHPGNVGEAIARLRPDVVDVSSGVERAPGEKEPERVRAFIAAAQGREDGLSGYARADHPRDGRPPRSDGSER